jgi:hypothetical protein
MIALFIALAIGAAILNSGSSLSGVAVVNAIVSFWSNGVLANFRGDPLDAPDWAALLSMATLVASGLLLEHLGDRVL